MTEFARGYRAGLEAAAKVAEDANVRVWLPSILTAIRALPVPDAGEEPDEPEHGTPFPPNFSYETVAEIAEFGEFVPSGALDAEPTEAEFEAAWARFLLEGCGEQDLAVCELLEMFGAKWMTREIMEQVLRAALRAARGRG